MEKSVQDRRDVEHLSDTDDRHPSDEYVPQQHGRGSILIRNAKSATQKEHNMTLLQGLRLYPKAVAWSMLISLCIAMEGFDLCLLNTFCKRLTFSIGPTFKC
jgi:hypothetical protein